MSVNELNSDHLQRATRIFNPDPMCLLGCMTGVVVMVVGVMNVVVEGDGGEVGGGCDVSEGGGFSPAGLSSRVSELTSCPPGWSLFQGI